MDNQLYLNALTVDVEDYFHVSAFGDAISRDAWKSIPMRVHESTNRLLDLFDSREVKATFFVLGWVAAKLPELVREINHRGHEVASHGFSHELVYRQEPAVFRQETEASKKLLEDITGCAVEGYRAASYSITAKSLWALDILIECGFKYDSSIFPVRHDRYGIPGSQRTPHTLTTSSGQTIVEFPLSTWRFFGADIPVAGGGYFRLFPYALTKHGLRSVNAVDHSPFVFYLHPWEVDPNQPRVQASWLSQFRHYNNLAQTLPRLERLLGDFRFGTMQTVLSDLNNASSRT